MSVNGTQARPQTAAPPDTISVDVEPGFWSTEDDDFGLFSFIPPTSRSPILPSSSLIPPIQGRPNDGSDTLAAATSSTPAPALHSDRRPLLQTPPDTSSMSPAAAYARAAERHLGRDGGWVQGATRKRASWQHHPEPPTLTIGDLSRGSEHRPVVEEDYSGRISELTDRSNGGLSKQSWSDWARGTTSTVDTEMKYLGEEATAGGNEKYKACVRHHSLEHGDGRRGIAATTLTYEDDDDSPFAEVRASVSNLDDPEMPCVTFRSMLLGILFSVVCGAANGFFSFRSGSPSVPFCSVAHIAWE